MSYAPQWETTLEARKRLSQALERLWTRDEMVRIARGEVGADRPGLHPQNLFLLQDPGGPPLKVYVSREQAGPEGFGHVPQQIHISASIQEIVVSDTILRVYSVIVNMIHELIGQKSGVDAIAGIVRPSGVLDFLFKPEDVKTLEK